MLKRTLRLSFLLVGFFSISPRRAQLGFSLLLPSSQVPVFPVSKRTPCWSPSCLLLIRFCHLPLTLHGLGRVVFPTLLIPPLTPAGLLAGPNIFSTFPFPSPDVNFLTPLAITPVQINWLSSLALRSVFLIPKVGRQFLILTFCSRKWSSDSVDNSPLRPCYSFLGAVNHSQVLSSLATPSYGSPPHRSLNDAQAPSASSHSLCPPPKTPPVSRFSRRYGTKFPCNRLSGFDGAFSIIFP